jgi:hyaluronoglucosaminidase
LISPPLGIVEGFFGPNWSWSDRTVVMRTLAQAGFSRYVYAPKGDAALRRQWDAPHRDEWLRALSNFAQACKEVGVEFGVGISPYGLHDEMSEARLALFCDRVRSLVDTGATRIAILFDDMDAGCESLAMSQMRIVESALSVLPNTAFTLCPSYYSDDIVLDRVFGARPVDYLETLGRSLDSSIEVFWTGPEVCSRQISRTHLLRVYETLRRKPSLWDNYPVNDGPRMSTQLHLRGFTGRSANIKDCVAAHYINPALQPMLSMIPALTLVDVYVKGDDYDYVSSFESATQRVAGDALALALREDLLAFQDAGLHRLDERKTALSNKYAAIDHPIAREVCTWLRGDYAVSAELVQTQ